MPRQTLGASLAFAEDTWLSSGTFSPFSSRCSAGTYAMQRIRDSTLKHSVTLGLEFCMATMAICPIWLVQLATWTKIKRPYSLTDDLFHLELCKAISRNMIWPSSGRAAY